jgi:hypothetical protein
MNGLLADVNVQGHLSHLTNLLTALGLLEILQSRGIRFATFPELSLDRRLDDRSLWAFCPSNGWVLWTENRNDDGPDSLAAVIRDGWQVGALPVLTLTNKGRFEHDRGFANLVASDLADILFGLVDGENRDQPRIVVPRRLSAGQ